MHRFRLALADLEARGLLVKVEDHGVQALQQLGRRAPRSKTHIGTFGRKASANGTADGTARAGDDGYSVLQAHAGPQLSAMT